MGTHDRPNHGGSPAMPIPITDVADDSRWEGDGITNPETPRCAVRGCAVVFASGEDRLCRDHADDDPAVTRSLQPYGYRYRDKRRDYNNGLLGGYTVQAENFSRSEFANGSGPDGDL